MTVPSPSKSVRNIALQLMDVTSRRWLFMALTAFQFTKTFLGIQAIVFVVRRAGSFQGRKLCQYGGFDGR